MKVKQLGLIVCVLVFLLIISSGCQNHKHIYGEWGVTLAATCTAEGIETRTCSCGEKEAKAIKAIHNFGEWKVTTAATCTAEEALKPAPVVVVRKKPRISVKLIIPTIPEQ